MVVANVGFNIVSISVWLAMILVVVPYNFDDNDVFYS